MATWHVLSLSTNGIETINGKEYREIVVPYKVHGVRDVNAKDFVEEYAAHLKKMGLLDVPDYVDFVKTGVAKELAPFDPDWFYMRAASVARQVYMTNNLGVRQLTKKHGGRHRRGSRPNVSSKGSGSVDRRALQALEKLGFIETTKKGRIITSKGRSDLDRVACGLGYRTLGLE